MLAIVPVNDPRRGKQRLSSLLDTDTRAELVRAMLLDVLSGFDELKICSSYRMPDGSITDRFLPDARRLLDAEPIWETMPGWQREIDDTEDRADLPPEANVQFMTVMATKMPYIGRG